MSVLDPCARCRRHIRRGSSCPFCARRAAGLAVVVGASFALAGCGAENNAVPMVPTDPTSTATGDTALPVATSDPTAAPTADPTAAPTSEPTPAPTGTASVAPTSTATDTDTEAEPPRPVAKYGIPQPRPQTKYGIPRPDMKF